MADKASLLPVKSRIREAIPADLARILEIERASDPSPWSAEAFRTYLEGGGEGLVLLACREGQGEPPAGYAVARLLDRELEVLKLAVHPQERCQGLASLLMTALGRKAGEAGKASVILELRESNDQAGRLYRRLGFVETGRRAGYYQDRGEAAILMEADLLSLGIVDKKDRLGMD